MPTRSTDSAKLQVCLGFLREQLRAVPHALELD